MLKQSHAYIRILNEKIEYLCKAWSEQYPQEIADRKIEDLMTLAKPIRQTLVHRDHYNRIKTIVDKECAQIP
jgi:hypothetical protein